MAIDIRRPCQSSRSETSHPKLYWVYGLLTLSLVLLVARFLTLGRAWRERPIAIAFRMANIGLGLVGVLSLLPVGIAQVRASVEHGL